MSKTILCFGDSHIRGVTPEPINEKSGLTKRYTKNKRWTGILQDKLGDNYDVVEEGIGGRTTIFDEILPGRLYRNGLTQLPVCLESHYPIHLVVLMLGTNDTKIQYNRSEKEIMEGMRQLVKYVMTSNKGPQELPPQVLVIAPMPIIKIPDLFPQFDDTSIQKTKILASLYSQMATEENCDFLDASLIVTASQRDGIHLDESACELLASAVKSKIYDMNLA